MEDRTQIKFGNPDIEGNPKPQLVTLEQENPVEGTSEREDGEQFVWHKWLVTNDQYFMASDSLDGMLKILPNKVGTVLKIQKVLNPNGGYPFFEVNGMNRDKLVTQATVANTQSNIPDFATDPQPMMETQPATTDGAITRLEQKLDKVITILHEMNKKEALPF